MKTWKINWSGGKDSTAACILHHIAGDSCKVVCYVPMLKDDIPLIMPDHYNFILSRAERFRSWGFDVHIVHGISYYDHVHRIISRGVNKGQYRGIGLGFGFCLFRNYSKIPALEKFKCDYDYIDIGIASDELKRQGQLSGKKRSILCEKGYTEKRAFELCLSFDMLSPIYFSSASRDGCAICPNAPLHVFQKYCRAYPESVPILLDIERFCKKHRPQNSPYRKHEWFSDRLACPYQFELNLL